MINKMEFIKYPLMPFRALWWPVMPKSKCWWECIRETKYVGSRSMWVLQVSGWGFCPTTTPWGVEISSISWYLGGVRRREIGTWMKETVVIVLFYFYFFKSDYFSHDKRVCDVYPLFSFLLNNTVVDII